MSLPCGSGRTKFAEFKVNLGLVAGSSGNDGNDAETLSDLEDFSDMFKFVEYLLQAPAYTSWPDSSEGSLGVCVSSLRLS